MQQIPEAITIPTGFDPKSHGDNTENDQLENCLLFVLHFSAPPYIFLNYCFKIKEKVSEYEISDEIY